MFWVFFVFDCNYGYSSTATWWVSIYWIVCTCDMVDLRNAKRNLEINKKYQKKASITQRRTQIATN